MKKKNIWYYLIILATIGIDQLTKWFAVSFLQPIEDVPLINGVLHLTFVKNTGAAFGILKDHRWVFMIVSSVAIAALLIGISVYKKIPFVAGLALSMVIGGGIGNMIDRIAHVYVVDFINFKLINFAVFNIADSFVCVGAALLIIYILVTDIWGNKTKTNKVEETSKKSE